MSVRHALLALLTEGPKYGLQLRQEFEARTGEVWPLNVGQVYTTLQRLERDGLVESDDAIDDGPQKAFRVTPAGEHELARWLRTPPDLSSPPRDELVIKVLVAMRAPGVDVHEVIQVHRRHLVELMQQWTRLKEYAAAQDVSFALAVDAELFRLDSVIRWLDAADGRIRTDGARTPGGRDCRATEATEKSGGAAMTALEMRGVSKVYGEGPTEVHALHEVDLFVEPAELVAVMGPSGSGKSTMLTIAGSLEEPTAGEVIVGGLELSRNVAQRQGPAAAAVDRLRVSRLQSPGRPYRGGERVSTARARRCDGQDGPGGGHESPGRARPGRPVGSLP